MKNFKLSLFALVAISLFVGCDDFKEHSVQPTDSGSANFTKYVAIGNSLAAGFQSNALYPEGQKYSYPNLLAQQFHVEKFAQPEIGKGYGDLVMIESVGADGPVTTSVTLNPGVAPSQPTGGYQNLGIPGAVLADFMNSDNGFATRAASAPYQFVLGSSSTSISNYFDSQNATFATFWLGNNDILGYVTSGGLRPFTSPADFQAWFTSSITHMMTSNPNLKLAVGNIPGVSTVPFGTTVGPKFKAALDANSIPAFVAQTTFYQATPAIGAAENRAPAKAILAADLANPSKAMALLTSASALGWLGASNANPADAAKVQAILGYWKGFLVTAGVVDQATANAMDAATIAGTLTNITYAQYASTFGGTPADAATALGGYSFDFNKPFGLDPQNPFPNQFILDENEISIANTVTNLFNGIITVVTGNAAFADRIALVNINSKFAEIVTAGFTVVDGITLAPVLGSLFSFDGVHPSNRGHAYVANEFIKAINSKFSAKVELINISWIPVGNPMVDNPS